MPRATVRRSRLFLASLAALSGVGMIRMADADLAAGGGGGTTQGELRHVPLEEIRLNPVALRDAKKTEQEFIELVDSVKTRGVLKPVLLRNKPGEDGKKYELVDGLQRFSASLEAGLPTIPAQIKNIADADAIMSQVVGNAVKIETQPVEYSKALMKILGYNPTWTETDLAARINKSPQWVGKMLGLLKLHDQIKPLVNEGKIVLVNAYALAKLPKEEQLEWVSRAQTTEANQFTQQVLARAKEIRQANRKGEDAGEEQFQPTFHLRKKPEIESEIKSPEVGRALISELKIATSAKNKDEAALAGFLLGLSWVGNSDPKSIEARKVAYQNQKKKDAEDKVRRDAEKATKRQKEADERAEKARKAAAEATEKASKLPPAEVAAGETAPV